MAANYWGLSYWGASNWGESYWTETPEEAVDIPEVAPETVIMGGGQAQQATPYFPLAFGISLKTKKPEWYIKLPIFLEADT